MSASRRTRPDVPDNVEVFTPVSFAHIDNASLKKYKRFYSLRARHSGRGADDDLYDVVVRHFASLPPPPENSTIDTFIYNVKNSPLVPPLLSPPPPPPLPPPKNSIPAPATYISM
eukprot:TRINITY_DN1589_c1_g1_i1.p1 TRINITY_DN1589_c1_g1~~TRINITY_DN1589_c1_g1_i1.p1  ORF type:complete len:127 (-),score=36.60 TRINITY_DN1589_c1_g1_i1:348-692(-)